ncbi:MAG: hypothetical protein V4694_03320 [Pseudomonadota bacterium]
MSKLISYIGQITGVHNLFVPHKPNVYVDTKGVSKEVDKDDYDYSEQLNPKIDPRLAEEIAVNEENLVRENFARINTDQLEKYQKTESVKEKLAKLYDEAKQPEKAEEMRESAFYDYREISAIKPELIWERYDKIRDNAPLAASPEVIKENIREFDKVLRLYPNAKWVHHDRGVCKVILGNEEDALKDFNAEIENDNPVSTRYTKLERGKLYEKKGNLYKAGRDFKDVLENPGVQNLYQNAQQHHRNVVQKYLKKTHKKFQAHQDCSADFIKLYEIAGTELLAEEYSAIQADYIKNNKKEEGVQFFQDVLSIENLPKNIAKICLENIENLHLKITQFKSLEKVISTQGMSEEYEDLLNKRPRNYFQEHVASKHYMGMGRSAEINAQISSYWNLNEEARRYNLASIIDLIDDDIKNNPNTHKLGNIHNKGLIYLRAGDYEKALESFRLIKWRDNFHEGLTEMSMGNYEKAVSTLTKAIDHGEERYNNMKSDPRNLYMVANRHYFRGIANMYQENYEEAREDFLKEREWGTNNQALKWLGLANTALGNDEEAKQSFDLYNDEEAKKSKASELGSGAYVEAIVEIILLLALLKLINSCGQQDAQNLRPDAEAQIEGLARLMFNTVLSSSYLNSQEKEALKFIDMEKVPEFMLKVIKTQNNQFDINEIISDEKRPELTNEKREWVKEIFQTAFSMVIPMQKKSYDNQIVKLAFPKDEDPNSYPKWLNPANFKRLLGIYNEEFIKKLINLPKELDLQDAEKIAAEQAAEPQIKGFAHQMFDSVLDYEYLKEHEKEALRFFDVDKIPEFMFKALETQNNTPDINEIIYTEKLSELTNEKREWVEEILQTAFSLIRPMQQNSEKNPVAKLALPTSENPNSPLEMLSPENFEKIIKIYNEEYIKELSNTTKAVQVFYTIQKILNEIVESTVRGCEESISLPSLPLPSVSVAATSKTQPLKRAHSNSSLEFSK